MKVRYDHQIFTGSRFGGISRYFVDIISELLKIEQVSPSVVTVFSNNLHLKELNNPLPIPAIGPGRLATTVASQINKTGSILALKKNDFDVFHPTYFHSYFLKHIQKPFVLTFHDTAAEDFPEYSELGNNKPLRQLLLDKATRVIAVSETTKLDMQRHYQIAADKIDVIHHATRFHELSPEKVENLPKRYILYVGQRSFYKNFNAFLAQISPVLKQENLPLMCVGGGDFSNEEQQLIAQFGLEDLVLKVRADSDEALLYVYQQATVFVYPSRMEGFGIPILEAMAANCPILLSDIPVFREIAQDAALYFKLDDAASLQEKLLEILDEAEQKQLIEKGKQRLKFFSWQKAAQQTLETYRLAAKK